MTWNYTGIISDSVLTTSKLGFRVWGHLTGFRSQGAHASLRKGSWTLIVRPKAEPHLGCGVWGSLICVGSQIQKAQLVVCVSTLPPRWALYLLRVLMLVSIATYGHNAHVGSRMIVSVSCLQHITLCSK